MPRRELLVDVFLCSGLVIIAFLAFWHSASTDGAGRMGHDYRYFLPQLLAGDFAAHAGAPFGVAWFTPAFCGGVPALGNPQNPMLSLPGLLSLALPPTSAVALTGALCTAVAFTGMRAWLRPSCSRAAAMFGAVLFASNGMFLHRMLVGHLTFHAFVLVPWVAVLVRRAGSRAQAAARVASAGALIAVMLCSGMLPLFPAALLAILLLVVSEGAEARGALARCAAALAVALALSAARIVAVLSFLRFFPRDDYALAGASSVWGAARLALTGLFLPVDASTAGDTIVNAPFPVEASELDFGLTPVALVLALIGLIALARARPSLRRLAFVSAWLLVPLALNVWSPSWTALLKATPGLASSSVLLRWFALYIPLVVVLAARGIDAVPARGRVALALLASAAAVAFQVGTHRALDDEQTFDPRAVDEAWRGPVVPIARVDADENDGLVRGVSPGNCYEPIFGYRLEHFPRGDLDPGPALALVLAGDALNLKNPACYAYPEQNHCAPGDAFAAKQRDDAAAFLAYRSFSFQQSNAQSAADAISGIAWLALCLALCLVVLGSLARRVRLAFASSA